MLPLALGFSLGVGSSPAGGNPALTADLFPVEAHFPIADQRGIVAQVDWASAWLESKLLTRWTVGLTCYHRWQVPLGGPLAATFDLGADSELGRATRVKDGALGAVPVFAIAPTARVGTTVGGEGFRVGVHLRGSIGRAFGPGDPLFARALVETTFLWTVKKP
jgi:hypothetical protein